ncbi:hypothetical protein EK904_011696 [Melospiza melodia maxima]|nr:hypothetical protein EK904_011696 [Melospiza melodia maxima]
MELNFWLHNSTIPFLLTAELNLKSTHFSVSLKIPSLSVLLLSQIAGFCAGDKLTMQLFPRVQFYSYSDLYNFLAEYIPFVQTSLLVWFSQDAL